MDLNNNSIKQVPCSTMILPIFIHLNAFIKVQGQQ